MMIDRRLWYSRWQRYPLLLTAALAIAVAAVFLTDEQHTSAASRVYLGVYQPGAPADMSRLSTFESDAGKHVAVVMWYQDWAGGGSLNVSSLNAVAAHGSVPLITWEPWDATMGTNQPNYRLAAILAGDYDSYVQVWAQQLAAYGQPVLLRWAQEMNGTWYPWGVGVNGNTPSQYVAAWQHLRAIFVAAGAVNVQWVWSPNVMWGTGQGAFDAFFPGESAVEWVGLDGYNWGAQGGRGSNGGWQSFSQVFSASYKDITALTTKPVMIAETASADQGGSKPNWITDAYARIVAAYPRITAVVWFNEKKERDWRIESTLASQRAFAGAVASPSYLGRWP
jgi:beta-mannanase